MNIKLIIPVTDGFEVDLVIVFDDGFGTGCVGVFSLPICLELVLFIVALSGPADGTARRGLDAVFFCKAPVHDKVKYIHFPFVTCNVTGNFMFYLNTAAILVFLELELNKTSFIIQFMYLV